MNEGINENYISLKFFEFDFSPGDLSKKLNLEPTHTALSGDKRKDTEMKWESNMWSYEETAKTNDFIGEMVESFVSRIILPRKEVIKQLNNDHYGELSVVQYYFDGVNPGYHFSKEIISIIHEVGLEIDIDTYCLSGI